MPTTVGEDGTGARARGGRARVCARVRACGGALPAVAPAGGSGFPRPEDGAGGSGPGATRRLQRVASGGVTPPLL